jgi:GNAT superfamily N-acetyltransferase
MPFSGNFGRLFAFGSGAMLIAEVRSGRSELARSILERLPQWFGRPDALEAYIRAADTLPMFAGWTDEGSALGFLSLKEQTAATVEAFVLGVVPEHHRRGVGGALFAHAEREMARRGYRFLTVKTLAASHPDPHYAATRRFYEAIGFMPLEVFPTLWDPDTPCLFMVKPLPPP